ncbi:hypothetical protein LTR53_013610 [Teratosphaeriaceae sp. CCFEE 6253]|nr:hypothetical protein LTR53_013610 [Teratosphaeriaceae sp. CCFEE 6253]
MSQRRRVCDACSIRRVRCDGANPCAACIAATFDCTTLRSRAKSGPRGVRQKTIDRVNAARHAHARSALRPSASKSSHSPKSHEALLADIPTSSLDTAQEIWSPTTTSGWDEQPRAIDGQDPLDARRRDVEWPGTLAAGAAENMSLPTHSSSSPLFLVRGPSEEQARAYPYRIQIATMEPYLAIFQHKLYPIWPIVGVGNERLVARLRQYPPEPDAYVLAASICVATILQLQLAVASLDSGELESRATLQEIEDIRRAQDYREDPNLDRLASSFLLHVAYLHIGRRTTSTLLLREAIGMAHVLHLHKKSHYEEMSAWEVQDHLRKIWLLWITERAHAIQHDLPFTMHIDRSLPALDENAEPYHLTAFALLCRMFTVYDEAAAGTQHSARSLMALHNRLRDVPGASQYDSDLQRADLSITQQWMRLIFWKLVMSQLDMTADPDGDIRSMLFPIRIAQDILSHISILSINAIEADGPGMELKLFEVANTVANVALCIPPQSHSDIELGPKDLLMELAVVLARFRGGNNALLPLLRSRLAEVGLTMPARPRSIELDQASTDSHRTRSLVESEEAADSSLEDLGRSVSLGSLPTYLHDSMPCESPSNEPQWCYGQSAT